MNTKTRFAFIISLVLLIGSVLVVVTWVASGSAPTAPGGTPTVVAYQGEVRVDSAPYTGDGFFKFAIISATGTTTYWSNDGTSTTGDEPARAVQLAVSEGLFSVLLGDTTLSGMTQALAADAFNQPDRYLRVWFSSDNITFDQLMPDTRIAAVPYALQAQQAADAGTVDGYEGAALEESAEIDAGIAAHTTVTDAHHARYTNAEAWAVALANDGPGSGLDADTVDGLHANELGATHYQNVIIVAKSSGDYTSVQAAIDSISDAAADNPYLVWVAPGVYTEAVTMQPHVHLQGAGQETTVITSTVNDTGWPPTQATLVLTRNVSLRDLSLGNSGADYRSIALIATAGVTRALVTDVTARALESSEGNIAVFLTGNGTSVALQQVTALAQNANIVNAGLWNHDGAATILHGGDYTARGGEYAWGIYNTDSDTTLEAVDVTALGENGSDLNHGLSNYNGGELALHGGVFTGRGGNQTGGVANSVSSTVMIEDVTSLGENGTENYGLANYYSATMTVRGAAVTARGGTNNYALSNVETVTLDAESVTALAENGSGNNHGFWNNNNAQATVRGGSFTGFGGESAYGIYNSGSGTTLATESITALGQDGSDISYGLRNTNSAMTVLHGGCFTGRGGTNAYGISNFNDGTTLEADSISALAENGLNASFGLHNNNGAATALRGGDFSARGGEFTSGILNTGNNTTLSASSVTALGENGGTMNYGLNSGYGATATLRVATFVARGGDYAYGIYNTSNNTMLEAESISALGQNGNNGNIGLFNRDGAVAMVHNGTFIARGGNFSQGIHNTDSGTTLEIANVTVLGENSSGDNHGLHNYSGAEATVRGGSITGRAGTDARGIYNYNATLDAVGSTTLGEGGSSNYGLYNRFAAATVRGGATIGRNGDNTWGIDNYGSGTTLEVENATVLGENGSSSNFGLYNHSGVTATVSGGSFTGRAGTSSYGIINSGTLTATSITAIGEDGSNIKRGLYNESSATTYLTQSVLAGEEHPVYNNGTDGVTISNSRLVGDVVFGPVTCVLVTRDTTISTDGSTCP